jgi:hypothetical protein
MSATFPINKETGEVYAHIRLESEKAGTFHTHHIMLGNATTAIEAECVKQYTDAFNELEWYKIVNTPHVRQGLRRLAAEARRQIAAQETQKGGFAVE